MIATEKLQLGSKCTHQQGAAGRGVHSAVGTRQARRRHIARASGQRRRHVRNRIAVAGAACIGFSPRVLETMPPVSAGDMMPAGCMRPAPAGDEGSSADHTPNAPRRRYGQTPASRLKQIAPAAGRFAAASDSYSSSSLVLQRTVRTPRHRVGPVMTIVNKKNSTPSPAPYASSPCKDIFHGWFSSLLSL